MTTEYIPAGASASGAPVGAPYLVSVADPTLTNETVLIEATDDEMEAASSATVFASPANVNRHPGASKGYCRITAPGALVANSYNVSSVTDTSAGIRTVVWDTDFSNSNYASVCTIAEGLSGPSELCAHDTFAVGSVLHEIVQSGGFTDLATSVMAMGDQ